MYDLGSLWSFCSLLSTMSKRETGGLDWLSVPGLSLTCKGHGVRSGAGCVVDRFFFSSAPLFSPTLCILLQKPPGPGYFCENDCKGETTLNESKRIKDWRKPVLGYIDTDFAKFAAWHHRFEIYDLHNLKTCFSNFRTRIQLLHSSKLKNCRFLHHLQKIVWVY